MLDAGGHGESAMSVEDDVWQGFVSSLVSSDQNKVEEVLSPEDAAWVDSCLIKDAELSESGWDALKDALLDVISSEAGSNDNTNASESNGFSRQNHDDAIPMNEEGTTEVPGRANDDNVPITEVDSVHSKWTDVDMNLLPEQAETALSLSPDGNMTSLPEQAETAISVPPDDNTTALTGKAESKKFRRFLPKKPSVSIDQKEKEDTSTSSESGFEDKKELFPDGIFKVWDLETPEVEEFELVQQFKKAIGESPIADALSPPLDDSVVDPDLESLEDLVAGLADLSLHQFTS